MARTMTQQKKKAQVREATATRRTAQGSLVTTRVDGKGRITLPADLRTALQIETGTMFAIRSEGGGFVLAPIENPFDALAAEAIQEQRAGRTRNLREFARENDIPVDGD